MTIPNASMAHSQMPGRTSCSAIFLACLAPLLFCACATKLRDNPNDPLGVNYSGGTSTNTTNVAAIQTTASSPEIYPKQGTYSNSVVIFISNTNVGYEFYYTVDGTLPTKLSSPYSLPILITSNTTLRAISAKANLSNSAVVTTTYNIHESMVSTLAGNTNGYADGTGTSALFKGPIGILPHSNGNVLIADGGNYRIRVLTPSGVVSTFAGSSSLWLDGPLATAKFLYPTSMCKDAAGNIYVVDNQYLIRKISTSGTVSTLAGSNRGLLDGTGSAAQFDVIAGITIDSSGNLFVADSYLVRKITSSGVVTTIAGSSLGYTDGTGAAARFSWLRGIAIDQNQNLLVADLDRIRKVTPSGTVTTMVFSNSAYSTNSFQTSSIPGVKCIFVDVNGDIYTGGYWLSKITGTNPGTITRLATSEYQGYYDGKGSVASFSDINGILLASPGVLYCTDSSRIRIITE